MAEFLATLREEHGRFRRLLDALDEQIQQLEAGTVVDYELIGEIVEYFLGFPDVTHHPKEDMLCAALAGRACGFVELQRRHIAAEEAVFPRAAELRLRPEDWEELSLQLYERQASAARGLKPHDFPTQSRNILGWQAEPGGGVSDSFIRPAFC